MQSAEAKACTGDHRSVLKSTAVVGGASLITLLLRAIRVKVLALLIGPAGVGLEAIYDSIINLGRTATSFGIHTSGVRQIAGAVGSADRNAVRETAVVLRRSSLLLGLLGSILIFSFKGQISKFTFGTPEHANAVGLLSVILLLASVSAGQAALLQGTRKIGILAKVQILGAFLSTVISIPMVYIWGINSIAPYLVVIACFNAAVSYWYVRPLLLDFNVSLSLRRTLLIASPLLKLGFAFLTSSLLGLGVLYVLRVMVTREHGLDGAGHFQAATTISTVYIGFILQAMGTDFFPKLSAAAENDALCNKLVNEQAEVSLLLAIPGLLFTLTLAPFFINLLYASGFQVAVDILRWQILGIFLRVAAWPLGFILIAKGRNGWFLASELVTALLHILFLWVGLNSFGLVGAGAAFAAMYLACWFIVVFLAKRITCFTFSVLHRNLLSFGAGSVIAVFLLSRVSDRLDAYIASLIICAVALFICAVILVRLVGKQIVISKIESIAGRLAGRMQVFGWRRIKDPGFTP